MSKNLKIGTLCSGYDSQCIAMDMLVNLYCGQLKYELLFWAEIDKYCIQAHNALYPQWADRNIGDITKVDWDKIPEVDILFYSTPCTDISNVGLRKGMERDSQTRSSIIWEIITCTKTLRPSIMIMENVKAITNKRNKESFEVFQKEITTLGYKNYTYIMNAKDYNVPQNRERFFMVSIHENLYITPEQPQKFPLYRTMGSILEDNVPDKYNLSEKMVAYLIRKIEKSIEKNRGFIWAPKTGEDIANCLTAHTAHDVTDNTIRIKQIGNLLDDKNYKNPTRGRIYDTAGIAPTLTTCNGGGVEVKIYQRSRGFNKGNIHDIHPTITTSHCQQNNIAIINDHFRRLTPREYFRLMDVPEEYIDKIQAAGISDTQQYKMAGNSIVVACLYHLLQSIFNPIL